LFIFGVGGVLEGVSVDLPGAVSCTDSQLFAIRTLEVVETNNHTLEDCPDNLNFEIEYLFSPILRFSDGADVVKLMLIVCICRATVTDQV